jgi:hypothetical protein
MNEGIKKLREDAEHELKMIAGKLFLLQKDYEALLIKRRDLEHMIASLGGDKK